MPTRETAHCGDFWEVVRRDLEMVGERLSTGSLLRKLWVDPGFSAVFHYRLGVRMRAFRGVGRFFSKVLWKRIISKNSSYISLSATIGPGLRIPHGVGIVIGDGVKIGSNVTIFQNVTLGSGRLVDDVSYPSLGDGVTIYAGAVVVGGVTLGNGVVVGANAVVVDSFSDNAIVAGAPARRLKVKGVSSQ
jgi:serine O-acetyltransferase